MNRTLKTFPFLMVVAGIALVLFSASVFPLKNKIGEREKMQVLYVNEHPIFIQVVTGGEEQERGLGGLDSLPTDQGMLFSFKESDLYAFWMKDMRFPIDIIWVGANLVVVDIAKDVPPGSYPAIFRPRAPALSVLELNAGSAERYGVNIGDRLHF